MLMMTPLTIPLWLLISSLLLAGLIGAGCLWHGHVARFTQTLTPMNTHTGSSLKTVHTASDHRSYSRLTVPF